MRILLVEDDELLGDSIKSAVSLEGYAVDWLKRGDLVKAALRTGEYDLLLLDMGLPGLSGIEVLQQARDDRLEIPVLVLTARDRLADKVAGLDAGADDYLVKPFEMDELFARIRSLLRRSGSKAPVLKAGELEMNPADHHVVFQGQDVDLTAKEFSMLEILLRNKGRFVTKNRLIEGITSWDEDIEPNTIEVYISRLRKRFGNDLIKTMRGVGYRLQ